MGWDEWNSTLQIYVRFYAWRWHGMAWTWHWGGMMAKVHEWEMDGEMGDAEGRKEERKAREGNYF